MIFQAIYISVGFFKTAYFQLCCPRRILIEYGIDFVRNFTFYQFKKKTSTKIITNEFQIKKKKNKIIIQKWDSILNDYSQTNGRLLLLLFHFEFHFRFISAHAYHVVWIVISSFYFASNSMFQLQFACILYIFL